MTEDETEFEFDVFISHASEDKAGFVRDLAEQLRLTGLRVWYDEWALVMGDRLRRKIDEGLRRSRFGVVVLSESFFAKRWTQQELDGLGALESGGANRILPVWHGVTQAEVASFSPTLADRLAVDSSLGVEAVVGEIHRAISGIPKSSPISIPMRRARRRSAVDERLRPRKLVGDEGIDFGANEDSELLDRGQRECSVACEAVVIFSLVPIGTEEEIDSSELLRWASSRQWAEAHPLAGNDRRPRADGLMVRQSGYQSELLTRYTHVSGDAYVEWGRALGGCFQDVCVVRLGPLLWAASHMYQFLSELKDKFELRSDYELVVSITHAKGTCLSHLGERWLAPWQQGYGPYRPTCLDQFVQYRRPLASPLGQEDCQAMLLALDRYLNRVWGSDEPRGHDHRDLSPSKVPILSDKFRDRDPWE